ncbi:MFS transporter [Clostridium beijerinckii]|uniref:MFS transporter n=1 Tax=Clostridium beijerinckii TaxID=1520 RepID=UPI0014947CB3|nr:MFS transporter [Clostridium beijerinckii]NOW06665.1 GPH family glycoside/pentoside/hexuronide:cation symporter [Clostridium beijerinckii]NYC00191.1 GPH family glycoside/pentoside/hexuronide:cation symporter [Clostridium beijerinckii]
MSNISKNTKISFWERFSYGCGDLGCNIIYSAMSAFMIYYYTDYIKVSALTVGTIMLFSRLLDGVVDLAMGVIVDRTKSRFGKCRSWILRMTIPFAISAVLLFSVPSGLGDMGKIIYIFVTYNLVSAVIYTAINVPYATLNALITQDQYERSVLSIFRMTLATVGTLIITNLTLPLVKFFGDNASAWTKTFIIFGILSIAVFLITFTGTKERVKPSKNSHQEKLPFHKGVKYLFQNKYWIMITITLVLIFINYSLNSGAAVYYAKAVLKDPNMVGPMNLVASIVQIAAMFFTAFIIKKIGKRNMLIIGSVIFGLGFAMFAFVGTSYVGIMTACALKGIGNAGISSCMFAIVSDTIEYGEWKTGYRTEGLVNSASSFGFKVGSGLGSAMIGWILGFGGYSENSVVQSASALLSINTIFIYIPIVVSILQIIVMAFYHLDKEYDSIIEGLNSERSIAFNS